MSSPDVKNDAASKASNSQRVILMGRSIYALTGRAARHENTKKYFWRQHFPKKILSGNFCCQIELSVVAICLTQMLVALVKMTVQLGLQFHMGVILTHCCDYSFLEQGATFIAPTFRNYQCGVNDSNQDYLDVGP